MSIKKLFLIGGAPLTGKTTLASKIAETHHAVALSTDNIRAWMQSVCNSADYPKVKFSANSISAEDYYQIFTTPAAALAEELAQAEEVAAGTLALIKIDLPWPILVLEGIAITPKLASTIITDVPHIQTEVTFLYDDDHDRIKSRVWNRGLWGDAETYSDDVKPLEVAWTIGYNEWFKSQATKYHYAITKVS